MPIDNSLPDVKLPVKLKTGEKSITCYYDQLETIKVDLLYAPTIDELLNYIPDFCTATWRDEPYYDIPKHERYELLRDLFDNLLLPTAYETINLTFKISGMDYIDVTHLLRHRMFSFSAQCTADRDQRHDDVVIKPAIAESAYLERFMRITEAAKELYAEMVDSNLVSILDARTILPRNLATFYYARGNLKDCMAFIRQRLDEQIQPMSDNVIAMQMWLAIVKQYPPLIDKIKIGGPDEWYKKTVPSGRGSNIYMPKPENDTFDYKANWFLYPKRRDEFPGHEKYEAIKKKVIRQIGEIKYIYEGAGDVG